MHTRAWLCLAIAIPLALAGCAEMDESSDGNDDANARHFTVNVPEGATQVHVDVTGRATGGEPDATVLIESETGANLATDTFSVGDATQRRVSVNVDGYDRLVVTVRVVDGDADLDVKVSATVPDRTDAVVIVHERVVVVQAPLTQAPPAQTPTAPGATPTPPASASPAPTPAATPPSPTPPATPPPATPVPTAPTNTTGSPNANTTG